MASTACVLAGAKGAGIYPTDSVEHVGYKFKHAGCAVAVVEGQFGWSQGDWAANQSETKYMDHMTA